MTRAPLDQHDYPNRVAAVDDFLCFYTQEKFGDLPDNLFPVSKKNTGDNLIMTQLAPTRPSINLHAYDQHILTGLCDIVKAVL